jgi:hypothetical protein
MSALAAVLVGAAPSLVAAPAHADKPADTTLDAALNGAKREGVKREGVKRDGAKRDGAKRDGAKREGVKRDGAKGGKTPHGKTRSAKDDEPNEVEHATPKRTAKAAADDGAKSKTVKKTASRFAGKGKKTAKRSDKEAPKRPCLGDPVAIDRTGIEGQSMRLVDCHHQPLESGRVALSVLARPWGARKPDTLPKVAPTQSAITRSASARGANARGAIAPGTPNTPTAHGSEEVAPGVRLLDSGLLRRLDAVTQRFPGKPLSLVSGYRPQSRGSQHQTGRALDFRVAGVSNEELVAFCKTLRDTGCGYYPNSSFVHMDVRNPGTGSVSWIDASGPGEGPRYVQRWPPAADDRGEPALPGGATAHDGGDDPWADLDDQHPAPPGSTR